MSHELDQTTGQAAMAYVEEEGKPWHELGRAIRKGASVEEIEEAAVLNWPVLLTPVKFDAIIKGKRTEQEISHRRVMYRGDTGAVLDIPGPDYVPHQNREVLEFFQEYLATGDLFIDTAGALLGGKQVWVQAAMNQGFMLPGKDQINGRILLMNPHQWGKGMIAKIVMERVVCWNTLQQALGEGGAAVKIWHTKEFNKARRDQVKSDLGIAKERLDAFKDDAKVLVKLTVAPEEATVLLARVLKQDEKKPLEQQNRAVTRMHELFMGAGKGAQLTSASGTGWGLLNAVTQFYDHEYGRSVEGRLVHAWLGQGDIIKRQAAQVLLQEAKAA